MRILKSQSAFFLTQDYKPDSSHGSKTVFTLTHTVFNFHAVDELFNYAIKLSAFSCK